MPKKKSRTSVHLPKSERSGATATSAEVEAGTRKLPSFEYHCGRWLRICVPGLAAHGNKSTAPCPSTASGAEWLNVPSIITPMPASSNRATAVWNSASAPASVLAAPSDGATCQ